MTQFFLVSNKSQYKVLFRVNLLKAHVLFILLLYLLISFTPVYSQTTSVTYTSSGTWTVPEGVLQVTVEAWGGGGGGESDVGMGGGGGAYAQSTFSVISGNNYNVIVGNGGAGGTGIGTKTPGGNGGNSIFGSNLLVAIGAQGVLGGLSSNCIGSIVWSGGNGGNGGGNSGGGGGGSAFTYSNGNDGINGGGNTGGTGGTGTGSGGNGGAKDTQGNIGLIPGGGGGGSGNKVFSGGNGAPGKVIITWCEPPSITSQPASQYITYGENGNFAVESSGIGLTYQWQVSENGGSSWEDISGETSSVLNLNVPTVAKDGNQYRCIVTANCGSFSTSDAATLTVTPKVLNVKAGNQSVIYGTPANTITQNGTCSLSDFVNGDNSSIINGLNMVSYSTNYTSSTNVGSSGIKITPAINSLSAANYSFVAVPGNITINKADQFINFAPLFTTKPLKDFVNEPVPLGASASSGLPVTITLGPGSAATLNYDAGESPPYYMTNIGSTGSVTIYVNQPGDGNYNPAEQVERYFDVTKSNQEIIFPEIDDVLFSNNLIVNMAATSTSALPVTYEVVSGPASVTGNFLNVTGAGNILVKASQDGDAGYNPAADVTQEFAVGKGLQTITIVVPTGTLNGLTQISATSTSGLPVLLNLGAGSDATDLVDQGSYYTLSGIGTVGTGEIIIVGNQPGNSNFFPADQIIQTIDLSKSNQTIDFPVITNKIYGNAPVILNASASSSLTVTYSIVSGSASIAGNILTITGAGTITVSADQAGDNDFNPAPTVTRQFEVFKATPVINLSDITKMKSDVPFQISPTSTNTDTDPDVFSFAGSNSTVFTMSGNTITITGAGTANLVIS